MLSLRRASTFLGGLLVVLAVSAPADATPSTLPAYFKLPPTHKVRAKEVDEVRYDHLPLHYVPKGESKPRDLDPKGRAVRATIELVAGNAPPKDPVADAADKLQKGGWTIDLANGYVVAHRTESGHDVWLKVQPWAEYWKLELVEEGNQPRIPKVAAPGKSETVKDDEDFPFLGHFDNQKLDKTVSTTGIFSIPHKDGKTESVWGPVVKKTYLGEDVSPYECIIAYRKALSDKGWIIDDDHPLGNMSNGTVQAHWSKEGRDLHASILCNHKETTMAVFDGAAAAEAAKLKKELDEKGSVALYGIYFAIDSDVLEGESEASLQQILKLLQSDAKLKLEVSGHTDDTGTPDHNKGLSEKRAVAVRKWLVDHKIDGARLTTAGYGATKPVGDNKTPEGRAKNRRVELTKK